MNQIDPSGPGANENDARLAAMMGLTLPRRAVAIFPEVSGTDWPRIARDPTQAIVFVNRVSEAIRLCSQGQAAIAVIGVSKGKLAKWLRKQGAKVSDRSSAN